MVMKKADLLAGTQDCAYAQGAHAPDTHWRIYTCPCPEHTLGNF